MKINKILNAIHVIALLLIALSFTFYKQTNLQQEIKYKNYLNQKYGFSVDYPSEILTPEGESDSGDGQVFRSKKTPNNTLTVYRDYLGLTDPDTKLTLEISYKNYLNAVNEKGNGRTITYKKLNKTFFIISGYNANGDIYYQKSVLVDGNLCTCLLEYRVQDKAIFNKVSERVFKSFN